MKLNKTLPKVNFDFNNLHFKQVIENKSHLKVYNALSGAFFLYNKINANAGKENAK